MAFLSLPNEIILEIVECLDNPWQVVSVICVNQGFYELLRDYPVRYNIRFQGSSSLIWAARNGRLEMVRNLLRLGPDVNAKAGSKPDRTALHIAAENGYLTMAKLLLEAGANPEVTGFQGQKPLFTALVSGHEEIAGMIFRKMCSLNVANPNVDETPLHVACQYRRPKAIRYFLEAGANVNAKDLKGSTPLQHLLELSSLNRSAFDLHDNVFETVSTLLEFGANPDLESLQTLRRMFRQTPDRKASIMRIGRTWMTPDFEGGGGMSKPYINEICLHLNLLERKSRQYSGKSISLDRQDSGQSNGRDQTPDEEAFPSLSRTNNLLTLLKSPNSIWGGPNVKRVIAKMLIPNKAKSQSASMIQPVEPFPLLYEHDPKHTVDSASRDKWAELRKPSSRLIAEGDCAKSMTGERKSGLEPRPMKAQRKKRWQPVQI